MRIEKINIAKYGRFSGFSLELDSYSLITGGNESGKSTVLAFIFFMLYGGSGNAYEEGGAMGSLNVRVGENRFRIDRVLDQKGDRASVFNISGGEKCFEGEVPGEALLGISKEDFKRICFLDQKSGRDLGSNALIEEAGTLLVSRDTKSGIKVLLRQLENGKRIYEDETLFPLEEKKRSSDEELAAASVSSGSTAEIDGRMRETENRIKNNKKKLDRISELTESYAVRMKKKLASEIAYLRTEYEDSAARCVEFRERFQRDGFFPDKDYLEELKTLSAKVNECDERIAELGDMIRTLDPSYASLFQTRSGKKHRHGYLLIFGILLCITVLPLIALTVFFFSVNTAYGIISAFGTLLIGAGAYICLKLYLTEDRALKDGDKPASNENSRELASLLAEKRNKENERAAANMRLCEQYSRWDESLDAAISSVSALLGDYERLSLRTASLREELEADEKQLAELRAAVPADETDIPLPADFDAQKASREFDFLTKANETLSAKRDELSAQLEETQGAADPAEIAERIYAVGEDLREARAVCSAYELAIASLNDTISALDSKETPRLFDKASGYIAKLTGGKYSGVGMTKDGKISLRSDGKSVDISKVSGATLDIVYLCIKLALADLTKTKTKLPMLLDDYFSRLDDSRLETAARYLCDLSLGGVQLIMTSSRERDEELYGFGVKTMKLPEN